MLTFEEYWNINKEKYIKRAMEDYNLINAHYIATIKINTDDDFSLDLGYDFTLYGESQLILNEKVIKHLEKLQVVNIKTIHKMIDGKLAEFPDYNLWYDIRKEAINQVKQNYNYIQVGGNQTITIEFSNDKLDVIKE